MWSRPAVGDMATRIIAAIGAAAAMAAVAAVWAALPAIGPVRQDRGALLRPDDRATVAQGAALYRARCASCHGVDLEGQPDWQTPGPDGLMPAPPHDATGHTWHHADRLLFDITKHGLAHAAGLENHRSAMPAYEGVLRDGEIIAVLSYIKSRWPQDIRERHDERNRRAAEAAR